MSRSIRDGAPLILAFDTSAAVCGAALLTIGEGTDARLLAERRLPSAGAQTRLLLPLFEELLAEVGATPPDLRGLVVGTGPGTFTGVRIGVAAARAAGLALGVPVVGVSSLAALAAEIVEKGGGPGDPLIAPAGVDLASVDAVVPLVDARRGQVFGGVYGRHAGDVGGSGDSWRRMGPLFVAAPEDAASVARTLAPDAGVARVLFCGRTDLLPAVPPAGEGSPTLRRDVDASFLVRGQHRLEGAEGDTMEGRRLLSWLAGAVGRRPLGAALARPGEPGTPESVRPIYVRAPDADLHITKMKDPWGA